MTTRPTGWLARESAERALETIGRWWTAALAPQELDRRMGEQRRSNRFRSIADYDARLAEARSDFRIGDYLARRMACESLSWADVPSGLGVALQEAVARYGGSVRAIGVDLVDWRRGTLTASDLRELERRFGREALARLLDKESFHFIRGDMARAVIPGGADLITAMCGLYYHDDPLGVWENLFNQLRPGGTLVAHFMLPKAETGLLDTYRRLADAISERTEASFSHSEDARDVREAVLVATKREGRRLFINAYAREVRPYQARWGRGGRFQIMVTDYVLEPEPVLEERPVPPARL